MFEIKLKNLKEFIKEGLAYFLVVILILSGWTIFNYQQTIRNSKDSSKIHNYIELEKKYLQEKKEMTKAMDFLIKTHNDELLELRNKHRAKIEEINEYYYNQTSKLNSKIEKLQVLNNKKNEIKKMIQEYESKYNDIVSFDMLNKEKFKEYQFAKIKYDSILKRAKEYGLVKHFYPFLSETSKKLFKYGDLQ